MPVSPESKRNLVAMLLQNSQQRSTDDSDPDNHKTGSYLVRKPQMVPGCSSSQRGEHANNPIELTDDMLYAYHAMRGQDSHGDPLFEAMAADLNRNESKPKSEEDDMISLDTNTPTPKGVAEMLVNIHESLQRGNPRYDTPNNEVFHLDRPASFGHIARVQGMDLPTHLVANSMASLGPQDEGEGDVDVDDEDMGPLAGRISPCLFRAFADGCGGRRWLDFMLEKSEKTEKEPGEVLDVKAPNPPRTRPVTPEQTGTPPPVPRPNRAVPAGGKLDFQQCDQTGAPLSPAYKIPSEPSVRWTAEGIDTDRVQSMVFHRAYERMDPKAFKKLDALTRGVKPDSDAGGDDVSVMMDENDRQQVYCDHEAMGIPIVADMVPSKLQAATAHLAQETANWKKGSDEAIQMHHVQNLRVRELEQELAQKRFDLEVLAHLKVLEEKQAQQRYREEAEKLLLQVHTQRNMVDEAKKGMEAILAKDPRVVKVREAVNKEWVRDNREYQRAMTQYQHDVAQQEYSCRRIAELEGQVAATLQDAGLSANELQAVLRAKKDKIGCSFSDVESSNETVVQELKHQVSLNFTDNPHRPGDEGTHDHGRDDMAGSPVKKGGKYWRLTPNGPSVELTDDEVVQFLDSQRFEPPPGTRKPNNNKGKEKQAMEYEPAQATHASEPLAASIGTNQKPVLPDMESPQRIKRHSLALSHPSPRRRKEETPAFMRSPPQESSSNSESQDHEPRRPSGDPMVHPNLTKLYPRGLINMLNPTTSTKTDVRRHVRNRAFVTTFTPSMPSVQRLRRIVTGSQDLRHQASMQDNFRLAFGLTPSTGSRDERGHRRSQSTNKFHAARMMHDRAYGSGPSRMQRDGYGPIIDIHVQDERDEEDREGRHGRARSRRYAPATYGSIVEEEEDEDALSGCF